MEISNPEQQLQQTTMETTNMEQSELVNVQSFNLYQTKTSLYNDILVYITSRGKIFGINMQYTSGYYFVYPEDKVNSSIYIIHNDKLIIIHDGFGVFLQAFLELLDWHHHAKDPTKPQYQQR